MATLGTSAGGARNPVVPTRRRSASRATASRATASRATARPRLIADRVLWIGILLTTLYAALAVRLFYVQVVRHAEFQQVAARLRKKEVVIAPQRGELLDRNGILLARNEPSVDVVVDPNVWFANNSKAAADSPEERRQIVVDGLSSLLPALDVPGKIEKGTLEHAKSGRFRIITIASQIDPAVGKQIIAGNLIGVGVNSSTRRVVVDGTLAPQVIGFTGHDGNGLDGLEHGLDPALAGKAGRLSAEFDSHRQPIAGTIHSETRVQNGRNIVLTLDSGLQNTVQDALQQAFVKHQAEGAAAIVLDPKTGDILACANCPTFDLNHRQQIPVDALANRVVSRPYEPGSTLKIITVAAALEEKKVTPYTRFSCNGSLPVGSKTIHCHLDNAFPHGHGDETLTDVIKNSCNVATAECAFRLGKEALYRYEMAFGFGASTGSGLPAENHGNVHSIDKWSNMTLANVAFGQGITVTPLQLAAAYAAIANGGVYHRPRIVWGSRNPVTQEMNEDKLDDGRRVISSETASQLRSMLQTVVDHGTGRNAQLDGYTAGGKTGTAQIAENKSYNNGKFVASFIGMAPMSDPQFVILVAVTDPKNGHFGADVSAPVFKQIAEAALLSRRVPHDKAVTSGKPAAKRPPVTLRDD